MPDITITDHLLGAMATVRLSHDGAVVDSVPDGWGGTVDRYLITDLKFENPQGFPILFVVTPEGGVPVDMTLGAVNDGQKHIPAPQQFLQYPLRFSLSRR